MEVFGDLVIKIVSDLVSASQPNAGIFFELDGFQLSYALIKSRRRQDTGFVLVQQLIVSAGSWSEDCMKQLLDILQECDKHDIQIQTEILNCLTACLKESHKCRTNFRKKLGFQSLVAVLAGLEGCLAGSQEPADPLKQQQPKWKDQSIMIKFLQDIIITLASSMRYEPANVKYFSDEIDDLSFRTALLSVGCFNAKGEVAPSVLKPNESLLNKFHSIFTNNDLINGNKDGGGAGGDGSNGNDTSAVDTDLRHCCLIFRMLYDLSIDNIGSGTNTPTYMMISIQSPRTSVTSDPSDDPSQVKRIYNFFIFLFKSNEYI